MKSFFQLLHQILTKKVLLFLLKLWGIILLIFYFIFVLLLTIFQDSMIFFPQGEDHIILSHSLQRIDYDFEGVHLSGFIRKGEGPTYFYFGGNASEAYRSIASLHLSGTIISFNYRGYGMSSGNPSEKYLFQDAVMLYDRLEKDGILSQKDTFLYGRSLGTGIAAYLSSVRPSRALILVTPYDSFTHVSQAKYPLVPVSLLLRHHFDSLKYLESYRHPIAIVYGGQDDAIPKKHTINLIAHLGNNVDSLYLENAGHNDILQYEETHTFIRNFIAQ